MYKQMTAIVIGFMVLATPAFAADAGSIAVSKLRGSEGVKGSRPIAILFTLENTGTVDDELVAVSSPVCGRAELHTHGHENGIMKMRKIDSIGIKAGGKAILRPMGDHVMCFDLTRDLKNGDIFALTLMFKSGVTQTVDNGVIKTISVLTSEKDSASGSSSQHKGHH